MVALTKIQTEILCGLIAHRGWQPRCGWTYQSESTMLRALKSLANKGFVYSHNGFHTALKDPAGNILPSSAALQCEISADNAFARAYGRGVIHVIVKPAGDHMFIVTGTSPVGLTHTIHLQSDLLSPIMLSGDNDEHREVATLERLVERIAAQRSAFRIRVKVNRAK